MSLHLHVVKREKDINTIMSKHKRIKRTSIPLNFEPLSFLESMPNAVIFLDREPVVRYVNERAVMMVGTMRQFVLQIAEVQGLRMIP
jgi:hypothetical protein